jgi:hypothetical protein
LGQRLGENGRRRMERFTLARAVTDTEQLLARRRRTADRHYRIAVSVARTIVLPFRLIPMILGVYRGLRRHGFSPSRFIGQRLRHLFFRCIAVVRKPRVTASGQA